MNHLRLPEKGVPSNLLEIVASEKAFLVDLRARARGLKKQGVDADQAGRLLTTEFKTKYPDWDWPVADLTNFVTRIYSE